MGTENQVEETIQGMPKSEYDRHMAETDLEESLKHDLEVAENYADDSRETCVESLHIFQNLTKPEGQKETALIEALLYIGDALVLVAKTMAIK